MLILSVEEARAGMKLAAPVQHPDNPEQELLKCGYVLQESVLGRMQKLGIAQVFIDYPALDDLDKHLEPFMSPARRQVYSQIKTMFAQSQSRTVANVEYKDYYNSVRDLVTTLMAQGRNPVYLEQMARLGADAVGHAAAVAHLSLLLGMKLENYLIGQRKRLLPSQAKDVVNLGVAGMLHDLGKTQLPPHLRDKNELSEFANDKDREDYQTHARLGYDAVHACLEASGATAVLNHHQHHDASGFPPIVGTDGSVRKLGGSGIHVFARILQVADLYDRLANLGNKVPPQRRSNLEILFDLRTKYSAWCDPIVVDMLHTIAPPFPPGSHVGLSDGTSAVVTEVDVGNPFRPTVKRLVRDSWVLEDKAVKLSMDGAPSVTLVGDVHTQQYLPV